MDALKAGWFTETGVLNSDDTTLSIKVDKLIHKEKTKFQDIVVFHKWV